MLLTYVVVKVWPKKLIGKPIDSAVAEDPSSFRGSEMVSKQGLGDVQAPLATVRTGPASSAYLYYTDELKSWAAGLRADI